MRPFLISLLVASALAAGCAQENPGTPPPTNRFYFPTGLAYVPDPDDAGAGFLYVASSDFDLRFNRGTLAAVDLSSLPLSGPVGAIPVHDENPHIAAQVAIDTFAGPIAVYHRASTGPRSRRIFIAGRQRNTLDVVDADGPLLQCGTDGGGFDCAGSAIALGDGLTDAYRPTVIGGGVYVSHLTPLDNPRGSGLNLVSSVARIDAESLGSVTVQPVGIEPVSALAAVGDFLFLGGRATFVGNAGCGNCTPLRALPTSQFGNGSPVSTVDLSLNLQLRDVRSLAVSSDGTRLFLVTRAPDALQILDVAPGISNVPRNQVIGLAELPRGATELTVIPRGPGRRDLVAVTCQTDNVVAIYDDELGRVTSELRGGGEQPFGIAAGPRPGGGARLYTTSFGRGNVAISDLPNLDDLTTAAVVMTLGPNENCLADSEDARPPECPK